MKKEIAEVWCAALRGGEYEQGKGRLSDGDRFCCLGVLCDLSGLESWVADDPARWRYGGYDAILPPEVMDWACMNDDNPEVVLSSGEAMSLASLNDRGLSFNEIADLIEANWETF